MRLVALMILLAVPCWAAEIQVSSDPPLPAPNLIANGGFEEGEGDLPAQWHWGTAAPDNFETQWTDRGHTGKAVYLKAQTGSMSGYWGQTVAVQPDTDYVMTGWFRLRGGKLLCYVHAAPAGGPSLNERFYQLSLLNHALVPVFLKPEYMRGLPDQWQPFRLPFHVPEKLTSVAVSAGMYFAAGEVLYDDFRLFRATTDLQVKVQAPEGLAQVQVLAGDRKEPLFDSGPLKGDKQFERKLPGVSTETVYHVVVTTADGRQITRDYPAEVAP
jgi:hypothetical protein